MELYNIELIHLIFEIIIFILLVVIASYASKRIDIGPNHFFNIESYFPKEEIHSLRQIFYLIMMGLFFINILYTLVFIGSDTIYLNGARIPGLL